jgi:glucose-1-phosphate thymidylyltransferase
MIYYPIQTLKKAGVTNVLIVTGAESAGDFLKLLGSGKEFGMHFTYRVQDEAGGIAQALGLGADFVGDDNCVVILGDNIVQDDIGPAIKAFKGGALVFIKEVPDPHRFGVPVIEGGKITRIDEKPKSPASNFAVTGIYVYDKTVFQIVKTLKPSARGELEITDVNNHYIKQGKLAHAQLKGYWTDAGTFPSLLRATTLVAESEGH